MQPPAPDLDLVLGISFDQLATHSLEDRRVYGNHFACLYCPNSAGGRWANSSQQHYYIFVNEIKDDLSNHLCLLQILEKLRVVPYFVFYGSLYNRAEVLINGQRVYASQAYYDEILRYIPRNRILCVGRFHPGFSGETDVNNLHYF